MIAADFDVITAHIAPMKEFMDIYLSNYDLSENESETDEIRSSSTSSSSSFHESNNMDIFSNLSYNSDAEQSDVARHDDELYPVFENPFLHADNWPILQPSDVISDFELCDNDQKGMLSTFQRDTDESSTEKNDLLKAILEETNSILRNQTINFFHPNNSSVMEDTSPTFDVEMEQSHISSNDLTDVASDHSRDDHREEIQIKDNEHVENHKQKIKRKKRKYERRASARKSIQLYQFVLRLLDEKDDCIAWVSREEGVFKLLKSKVVADMWGKYKKNENMTYESLSRALRHYYAQEILVPVPKKLHYKFCKKTLEQWYKTAKSS